MADVLYLYSRTVKNGFLKVVKKPASLIGYLVLILLFAFNAYNASNIGDTEESMFGKLIFLSIAIFITYFSAIIPIYKGTKDFTLKFLPADGIYLMSGPVKATKILWYAQVKQSTTALYASLFMLFQIPLLKSSAGMDKVGVWLFLFGFFLLNVIPGFVSLMAFVLGLKNEGLKILVRIATMVIGGAGLIVILTGFMNQSEFINQLYKGLTSDLWIFIPLIGWIQMIIIASITGIMTGVTWISIGLCFGLILVSVWVIYTYADTEFYEDALDMAFVFKDMKDNIKKGQNQFQARKNRKAIKTRKVKNHTFRTGLKAVVDKQLLIAKKKKSGIFGMQSIAVFIVIVGSLYFTTLLDGMESEAVFMSAGMATYALFFVQLSNNADEELRRHYLYMFPYGAMKKLLSLKIIGFLVNLLVCIGAYIIGGILTENTILECIAAGILIGCVGLMFDMISTLAEVIFGQMGTVLIRIMFKLILVFIFVGIVVAPIAIVMGASGGENISGALLLGALAASIISGILLIPASYQVKNPEYND